MRLTGEHLFTIDALLGEVVDVGTTPTGRRRVIPVVGGTVSGRLEGHVLPGGADWNLQRSDGSAELWARYELRLLDGSAVSVTNTAVHEPDPRLPILTSPQFDVGDGGPVWLRTGVFVGLLVPRLHQNSVRVEVHRVGWSE
ncbi:DUF3237 family protein [uncultured Cellulomonas sp.]|uniref:DUF3237 family protein n=1 Tax=uncultured Cellulomonas sp. TaxID=189682 RepID=UPI0028F0B2BC|nr:DUF3237 family protein [uncultured Cellulomonas sp.]